MPEGDGFWIFIVCLLSYSLGALPACSAWGSLSVWSCAGRTLPHSMLVTFCPMLPPRC